MARGLMGGTKYAKKKGNISKQIFSTPTHVGGKKTICMVITSMKCEVPGPRVTGLGPRMWQIWSYSENVLLGKS